MSIAFIPRLANRAFCKERGIRISAPPLGRPHSSLQPALIQQRREDERFRNAIEGKFGQAKRRFSLGRIMAKLSDTAESTIAISFLVMNLELLLRQFFVLFFDEYRQFSSHRRSMSALVTQKTQFRDFFYPLSFPLLNFNFQFNSLFCLTQTFSVNPS